MRLDDLVVLGLLLGVVALDVARGASGPSLAVVLAAAAAIAWITLSRRPRAPAPAPSPPAPAILLRVRDVAGTVGAAVTGARTHGVPVLVVDDGSTDGTALAAERAGGRVIRHPRPRGPGPALLTGLRAAARLGCSHVVALSPEGVDDPVDVHALLAAVRGAPLAVHVLTEPPGVDDAPARRVPLRLLTGWSLRDGGGARAWPVGPTLELGCFGPPAALETELLTRAAWAGLALRPLPRRGRATPAVPHGPAGALVLTHALLLLERVFWPPRWIRRVRAPPARAASPRGWWRRVRLGGARLVRLVSGSALPLPHDGGEHLAAAFDGARGAVLLTAAIGDPSQIPRPRGAAKTLHVLTIRPLGARAAPPPAPGRRLLHVTPAEGYLALPALRALRAGEVLLVEGDRVVDERVVHARLLGRTRELPAGPWLLAALAHVPVILLAALEEPDGWHVYASPPMECTFDESSPHDVQIAEWAQRAAAWFEVLARRFPARHQLAVDGIVDPISPNADAEASRSRGGVAGGLAPPPQEPPPDPYG